MCHPKGPVYQAGTLSGNPVAMAAGFAILAHLNEHRNIYKEVDAVSGRIVAGIKENLSRLGLGYTINHIGSMFSLFFTDKEVYDFTSAKQSDTSLFGIYFREMLAKGIYLAPSQFEALFISHAITDDLADQVIQMNYEVLSSILVK